jgi:RimJ/RimL family protein N-acetyltransferase
MYLFYHGISVIHPATTLRYLVTHSEVFYRFSNSRLLNTKMPTESCGPEGDFVSPTNAIAPAVDHGAIVGKHVTLTPLLESHAADLYKNLGEPQDSALYRYLPAGPFGDLLSFTSHIATISANRATLFPYAILSSDPIHRSNQDLHSAEPTPIGIICLLNINVPNRTIEIGYVLFPSSLQRSTAATEAVSLLMKLCFDKLHYVRVEWKCNNLNEPSKRAALRLGFMFEGLFRKHMIVKGRRRDTAWFSVIDDEWNAEAGEALVEWMADENFDREGRQRRKLEVIREGLVGGKKQ